VRDRLRAAEPLMWCCANDIRSRDGLFCTPEK